MIQRRRKRNRDNWLKIAKDYKNGAKIEDIKAKYKISKSAIYYILDRVDESSLLFA